MRDLFHESVKLAPRPARLLTAPFLVLLTIVVLVACDSGRSSAQRRDVTFDRDVAPILYKHCAACHQPEDIAPFSVLEYKDVLPWKQTIRQKVAAREMPPWHADPRYGDFANAARLNQQEIDTITSWRSEERR